MKQLFLCLTGLLCIFHAASAAHAQLYEWVRTIENPTGSASEFFGDIGSVAFVEDRLIVGAHRYDFQDEEDIQGNRTLCLYGLTIA